MRFQGRQSSGRGGRFPSSGPLNGRSSQQRSGTSLPASLLTQIETEDAGGHGGHQRQKKGRSVLNRKQLRKEARVQKKQKHVTLQHRKRGLNEHDSLATSHGAEKGSKNSVLSKKHVHKETFQNGKHGSAHQAMHAPEKKHAVVEDKEKEERQLRKLAESNPAFFSLLKKSNLVPDVRGIPTLKEQQEMEDEDDRNIRILSKRLRLKKGKLTKGFKEDGLDFLLEGLGGGKDLEELEDSHDTPDSSDDEESEDDDEMELIEDMPVSESDERLLSTGEGDESDDQEEPSEMESMDELSEYGSEEHEASIASDDTDDLVEDDLESSDQEDMVNASDDDLDRRESGMKQSSKETEMKTNAPQNKATDDSRPAGSTRYIPPHLRQKTDTMSEENIRLNRQIKGYLNRLSDANMESIVIGIDEIYRNNPRQYVTEAITNILLTFVGDHANLLESFVATYSAFVSCMHNIVGVDFGAHFIQTLMEKFDSARTLVLNKERDETERASKESTNLLLFLAYLYNFQVVSCVLMYDVIRMCLESLTETDVEHLLKILKICGHQLRSDDPLALKEIVLMVKDETSKRDASVLSVRHKFMVETIMDLKNNKRKAHLGNTTQLQEERLRKFIKNTINRRSLYGVEALRVTLDDIRNIKSKGKWWLVGAAWTGHDSTKIQEAIASRNSGVNTVGAASSNGDGALSKQLLDEARRQRMNTDVRRSIFVILMSSEDCIDAFERLLKLGLKDKQERDIVRVLMHCCSQEKVFNLFYALVSLQFCEYAHRFKITFQYALWDIFKAMKEQYQTRDEIDTDDKNDDFLSFGSKQGIRKTSHLARMFGYLISKDALPLSILKSLDFTTSLPPLQNLFLLTMIGWFVVNATENTLMKAFRSLKSQPALTPLCEGLSLFLKVSMIQGIKRGEEHLMSIEQQQVPLALERLKLIRKLIE